MGIKNRIRVKFFNCWKQMKLTHTSYMFNLFSLKFYWNKEFRTLEINFTILNLQLVTFIG